MKSPPDETRRGVEIAIFFILVKNKSIKIKMVSKTGKRNHLKIFTKLTQILHKKALRGNKNSSTSIF